MGRLWPGFALAVLGLVVGLEPRAPARASMVAHTPAPSEEGVVRVAGALPPPQAGLPPFLPPPGGLRPAMVGGASRPLEGGAASGLDARPGRVAGPYGWRVLALRGPRAVLVGLGRCDEGCEGRPDWSRGMAALDPEGHLQWADLEADWDGAWAVADVDGDGTEDLVTYDATPPRQPLPGHWEVDHRVALRSGAAGRVIWQRTWTTQAEGAGLPYRSWIGATEVIRDSLVFITVLDPRTRPGIFLSFFTTVRPAYFYGVWVVRSVVLEAATGHERFARLSTPADQLPTVLGFAPDVLPLPLADLDGDGYTDLVAEEYDTAAARFVSNPFRAGSGHLRAISGADGRVLWEEEDEMGYDGRVWTGALEDRGRGAADVLLVDVSASATPLWVAAGDTGRILWVRWLSTELYGVPPGYFPEHVGPTVSYTASGAASGRQSEETEVPELVYGLGDLDGDATQDFLLLTVTWTCPFPLGGRCEALGVAHLWALSGATGRTLWSRTLPLPFLAARWTQDLDGDGVQDLLYAPGREPRSGEWCGWGGICDAVLTAMAGRDGHDLWRWSAPLPEDTYFPYPVWGDLDTDGAEDLVVGGMTVFSGRDGARLWGTSCGLPACAVSRPFAADVDTRRPGPEVVASYLWTWPGTVGTYSLYGADGQLLWTWMDDRLRPCGPVFTCGPSAGQ